MWIQVKRLPDKTITDQRGSSFHNGKDLTLQCLHRRRQSQGFERPVPPGRHSSPDLFLFPSPTQADTHTGNQGSNKIHMFTKQKQMETSRRDVLLRQVPVGSDLVMYSVSTTFRTGLGQRHFFLWLFMDCWRASFIKKTPQRDKNVSVEFSGPWCHCLLNCSDKVSLEV